MKKILSVLLTVFVAFGVIGCAAESDSGSSFYIDDAGLSHKEGFLNCTDADLDEVLYQQSQKGVKEVKIHISNSNPSSSKISSAIRKYTSVKVKLLDLTYCTRLSSVDLEYCSNVEEVILADGMDYVGCGQEIVSYDENAKKAGYVYDCAVLKLGKNIEEIFKLTDSKRWRASKYEVAKGNKYFSSDEQGILYNKDKTVLINPGKNNRVSIPSSVITIEERAFYDCSGLTSVTIPDSVTSIGVSAFDNCRGLTSVTIPDSVTSIGDHAFYYCSGLTNVTIPDSVTSIGNGVFCFCSGLTNVTIPDSVTSIGNGAFGGCSGLTSVTIPNSVTSMGESAFEECSGLTSVTIGDSVTSIGRTAFFGCSGLTSVTIGDSVTSIGSNAFKDCSGLTSVTIPESVTSIGEAAFYGCSGLTSVTIPDSVTRIGVYAFYWCHKLTTLNYTGTGTWYVTSNSDYTRGSSISLTLSNLTSNNNKYWYKKEN